MAGVFHLGRELRVRGGAVHVWFCCFEFEEPPSEKIRRITATAVFDAMLDSKTIEPTESAVVFYVVLDKVHSMIVSHNDHPPLRMCAIELKKLWRKVLTKPTQPQQNCFSVHLNMETETIDHTRAFVGSIPPWVATLMELSGTLPNIRMCKTTCYTSTRPYGPTAEKAAWKNFIKCCSKFLRRFYSTPRLVGMAERLQDSGELKALHCHLDWDDFVKEGTHYYDTLPLWKSPIWPGMDPEKFDKLCKSHRVLIVVQITFDRQKVFSIAVPLDLEHPGGEAPLAETYTITTRQSPPKYACASCNILAPEMPHCMRCKAVHYCSDACRLKDWSTHKKMCAKIAIYLGFPLDYKKNESASL